MQDDSSYAMICDVDRASGESPPDADIAIYSTQQTTSPPVDSWPATADGECE